MTDEELIDEYWQGWKEAGFLNGNTCEYIEPKTTAFITGFMDFIAGDDSRSFDYQTDEEILKRIKNG